MLVPIQLRGPEWVGLINPVTDHFSLFPIGYGDSVCARPIRSLPDIASVSVEQCEQRYLDMRKKSHRQDRLFSAEFITADCTKVRSVPTCP